MQFIILLFLALNQYSIDPRFWSFILTCLFWIIFFWFFYLTILNLSLIDLLNALFNFFP